MMPFMTLFSAAIFMDATSNCSMLNYYHWCGSSGGFTGYATQLQFDRETKGYQPYKSFAFR
jgi:hypothetical protein